MAWSPFRRANAGIIWVAIPGDYANQIPTTSATAPAHALGASRRHGDLLPRIFPRLDERDGVAKESLARDRQPRPLFVANKKRLSEQVFERVNAGAYRSLSNVQFFRRRGKTAGLGDGQKRPG
jgi:hypothetical protein